LKKLEKEIASLELKKEDLQNQFANNSLSTEDIKSLSIELKGIEDDLSTKTDDWFTRSIELE
jgi:ATP-binding cassette subfamily F protein uup